MSCFLPADLNKNPLGFGLFMLVWHQNEQEVKCEIFTFISCSKRKHESLQQMHLLWRTLMKCSTGFVCSLSDWLETNQNNWNQSFRKEKKKEEGTVPSSWLWGTVGKVLIIYVNLVLCWIIWLICWATLPRYSVKCYSDVSMKVMFKWD